MGSVYIFPLWRDDCGAGLMKLSDDELRARRRRNLVIALTLAAFVALVFVITLTKLRDGSMLGPA